MIANPFWPMADSSIQHIIKDMLIANYVPGTALSTKNIMPTLTEFISNGKN